MAGRLVLLASYPKSGNTWMRLMMERAVFGRPVDLRGIGIQNAAQRGLLDNWLGLETSDLSDRQAALLRPWAYEEGARREPWPLILKAHDALLPLTEGIAPPFSVQSLKAVIYIIRDPRDVAISWAHHMGVDVDEAIARMGDRQWVAAHSTCQLKAQVVQLYSSWSAHVQSWTEAEGISIRVVRYEDLRNDPAEVMSDLLDFAGLSVSSEILAEAVAETAFDRLRRLEREQGFAERPRKSTAAFFRGGRSGGWQAELSTAQIARLEADHGAMMSRYGYLPAD